MLCGQEDGVVNGHGCMEHWGGGAEGRSGKGMEREGMVRGWRRERVEGTEWRVEWSSQLAFPCVEAVGYACSFDQPTTRSLGDL